MNHPALKRLPKKLTICFELWLPYGGTPYSPYYDIEKVMIEHKERGFNCIRMDSGAGLTHDINGNRRGPFTVADKLGFGKYEVKIRQQNVMEPGSKVDLMERVIEICEKAKKHGIYIMLSSWYYLHGFWFQNGDDPTLKELFEIPMHQRITYFAKYLHYIIKELEDRGLADVLVSSEIFNEINDLPFTVDIGGQSVVSAEELAEFTAEHERALEFLQKEHPDQIFAYDSGNPCHEEGRLTKNMQAYIFHTYYMWGMYDRVYPAHPEWQKGGVTIEDVAKERDGRRPATPDWYDRVARSYNFSKEDLPEIENTLEQYLLEHYDEFKEDMLIYLDAAVKNANGLPLLCGEGVTYVASKEMLWEEKSDTFWKMIDEMIDAYKKAGVWGTILKTCLGIEDPSWYECPERIKRANERFLAD